MTWQLHSAVTEGQTLVLPVREETQIGESRRAVGVQARLLEFDEGAQGRIAIIASEMATNLVRHGGGGEILCRLLPGDAGIELIACDRGRGMVDVEECLRDGFSTAGTAGTGLGAIRRLANLFDLYSAPGVGTVVLAQVLVTPAHTPVNPVAAPRFIIGAVCVPLAGEIACGDRWLVETYGHLLRVTVVDGLGHGMEAATAAVAAIRTANAASGVAPAQVLDAIHRQLGVSRGAAVAICHVNQDTRGAVYCGIGNIAGVIVGNDQRRGMVSHNGIVGHQMHPPKEFAYPWVEGALLVMHSDGLQTRWSLEAYPGLRLHHPGVIAAVLRRDFTRGNDDLCVVVVKERS
jgi:anti-sigma regulatory factor (Ser/Thr protein kinase)